MSLPLVTFWKRLLYSGLVTPETPQRWAAKFADDHDGKPISDVVSLAKWAVRGGRLTSWQAQQLISAPQTALPRLRVESITLTGQAPPLWFDGRDTLDLPPWTMATYEEGFDDPEAGVLLRLPATKLTDADGDRLRQHASLHHDSLQPIRLVGMPSGCVASSEEIVTETIDPTDAMVGWWGAWPDAGKAQSDPNAPRSATHICGPLDSQSTAKLLQPICAAVAAMHAVGLVHGRIERDAIIAANQPHRMGSFMLARDPTTFFSRLTTNSTPLTIGDDIRALGWLACQWRFGDRPRDEMQTRLDDAQSEGAKADLGLRVFASAVAQDPALQFKSVEAFVSALNVVADTPAQSIVMKRSSESRSNPKSASTATTATVPQPTSTIDAPPKARAPAKPKPDSAASKQTKSTGQPQTIVTPAPSTQHDVTADVQPDPVPSPPSMAA
ncbi:MAG: hypothetical protein AAF745_19065, partial [Planctomycetota bacterium]